LTKTKATSGKDPYFLYAVSNAGSLLALLAYPVLIEPRSGVRVQSESWFAVYAVLVLMVLGAALVVWKSVNESTSFSRRGQAIFALGKREGLSWKLRLYCMAAALVPSALMLAVTNHMLLNLASVPFLWVMPLAIYLVTFMMAFARRVWLSPTTLSGVVAVVLLLLFPLVAASKQVSTTVLWYVLASHLVVLFAGALLCHTALALRRPEPRHLTEFYFWVALGGALGGIFTAIVAPFVFRTVIEYPLLVALLAFFRPGHAEEQKMNLRDWLYPALLGLLVAVAWYAMRRARLDVMENLKTSLAVDAVFVLIAYLFRKRTLRFALGIAVLIFSYHYALPSIIGSNPVLYVGRDFFGIKKVDYEVDSNMRRLLHGDTLHGLESQDPLLSGQPISYFHETGPVGDVMKMISSRANQKLGVIGLGTGSMAGWARSNRHVTFFDIDPQVYEIAWNFFTFLRRCGKNCDVVIGDGRLAIEKVPDTEFDVLMLDAFNSDSIPAHLVSREALQLYLKKLKSDGVLLFHVSNKYMNVQGLVAALIADASLEGLVRFDDDEVPTGKFGSDYVVAARRPEDVEALERDDHWLHLQKPPDIQPWTDDYSNMLKIVYWR
jgi:SAM-dependent methyltransferase